MQNAECRMTKLLNWSFDMERFILTNDPPRPAKRDHDDGQRDRQRVLFAGLDCLSGQMDLFATDGELDEGEQP